MNQMNGKVYVGLTPEKWQALLLCVLQRQKDAQVVRGDYPQYYKQMYSTLDVKLEQLKMEIVGQIQ